MITYYERLEDGTIGASTTDLTTANELGLTLTTDEEIITVSDGLNGDKRYLKSEFEELQKTEEYKAEQIKKRKEEFYKNFIETSLGNFRKQPKGYSNAVQSIDVINQMAQMSGGLNEQIATLVIFYPTPNFSDPEQCNEEWLVENQYNCKPLTLPQWAAFYVEFQTKWAMDEYK